MTELEILYKKLSECTDAHERACLLAAIEVTQEYYDDYRRDSGSQDP